MRIKFLVQEIVDAYVKDNFRRLQDAIDAEPLLKGEFKFFEFSVESSVVEFAYPHHLNFQPKDILLLSVSDDQDVTFHYSDFTSTDLFFTTTGACTIRCFVGRYEEGVLR